MSLKHLSILFFFLLCLEDVVVSGLKVACTRTAFLVTLFCISLSIYVSYHTFLRFFSSLHGPISSAYGRVEEVFFFVSFPPRSITFFSSTCMMRFQVLGLLPSHFFSHFAAIEVFHDTLDSSRVRWPHAAVSTFNAPKLRVFCSPPRLPATA